MIIYLNIMCILLPFFWPLPIIMGLRYFFKAKMDLKNTGMIDISDLIVSYGKNRVINGLNIKIEPGTVHGLVGLNGSGKTTLLNTLYGLKKMDSGKITYKDLPVKRTDLAYFETENYFYPYITGKEYLQMFRSQNTSFNIAGWNQLFDLPLDKLTETYSTGMKKKLAFMGLISLNRNIYILDEPFNGIDLETVQKIKALLIKLKENNKTIIITSHILESLLSLCDFISYLNGGIIQFTKEKKDFASVETEIFSVHKDHFNKQIQLLLGSD
ncbi:MAG: ATP-binding cassette domain-containing protein [Bacteroidales bacterium]|nr:ATP-binding cassette domain-containing protein [Bacteroidales bacterium]